MIPSQEEKKQKEESEIVYAARKGDREAVQKLLTSTIPIDQVRKALVEVASMYPGKEEYTEVFKILLNYIKENAEIQKKTHDDEIDTIINNIGETAHIYPALDKTIQDSKAQLKNVISGTGTEKEKNIDEIIKKLVEDASHYPKIGKGEIIPKLGKKLKDTVASVETEKKENIDAIDKALRVAASRLVDKNIVKLLLNNPLLSPTQNAINDALIAAITTAPGAISGLMVNPRVRDDARSPTPLPKNLTKEEKEKAENLAKEEKEKAKNLTKEENEEVEKLIEKLVMTDKLPMGKDISNQEGIIEMLLEKIAPKNIITPENENIIEQGLIYILQRLGQSYNQGVIVTFGKLLNHIPKEIFKKAFKGILEKMRVSTDKSVIGTIEKLLNRIPVNIIEGEYEEILKRILASHNENDIDIFEKLLSHLPKNITEKKYKEFLEKIHVPIDKNDIDIFKILLNHVPENVIRMTFNEILEKVLKQGNKNYVKIVEILLKHQPIGNDKKTIDAAKAAAALYLIFRSVKDLEFAKEVLNARPDIDNTTVVQVLTLIISEKGNFTQAEQIKIGEIEKYLRELQHPGPENYKDALKLLNGESNLPKPAPYKNP